MNRLLNKLLWFRLSRVLMLLGALTNGVAADGPQQPRAVPVAPLQIVDLVRQTLERNPEIQAAPGTVNAAWARISQARAWPDPRISFSYGGNALPPLTLMRGDLSSQRQIMAEQEIPYPGKTKLRSQIATQEATAEQLNYEARGRFQF